MFNILKFFKKKPIHKNTEKLVSDAPVKRDIFPVFFRLREVIVLKDTIGDLKLGFGNYKADMRLEFDNKCVVNSRFWEIKWEVCVRINIGHEFAHFNVLVEFMVSNFTTVVKPVKSGFEMPRKLYEHTRDVAMSTAGGILLVKSNNLIMLPVLDCKWPYENHTYFCLQNEKNV